MSKKSEVAQIGERHMHKAIFGNAKQFDEGAV